MTSLPKNISSTYKKNSFCFDILEFRKLKSIIKSRKFQFSLQLPIVIFFVLIIVTGINGIQDPGRNLSTVATWTVWWIGIIFLILFSGASWCLVCPWSAISDWLERLSFWKKKNGISLGIKWFKNQRNRHPATVFFIIVTWLELGVFITYSPLKTAYLAFSILFLAVITALIFKDKVFCRYVCFVGGIIGMYSNLSPIEVRSKSNDVCLKCKTKDCIRGNEKGYGCPIYEYPGGMENNSNCILCTECIKTCPHDNMTVNIRPFFTDISRGYKAKADEALLILTLLSLTIYHGFTMLPVWTDWASQTIVENYPLYIITFTLLELGFISVFAGVHLLCSYIIKLVSNSEVSLKNIYTTYSYVFLPLALFYHLAHNADHFSTEGLKILPVLSDPFGWGWNIFGTAKWEVAAIMSTGNTNILQISLIIVGLFGSVFLSYKTTAGLFSNKNTLKIMTPVVIVILVYSLINIVTIFQPMVMRTESYICGF